MISPTAAAHLLWEAVAAARLAPSIHNTQPWHFVLTPGALQVHADRDRQLRVADPDGRQLMLSCGCAVFNARTALAARGYEAVVHRLPDPDDPSLVAYLELPARQADWVPIAALEPHIARRRSNRGRFLDTSVAASVRCELDCAARQEQAELFEVREHAHRLRIVGLGQQADLRENTDPVYRQELTAWTTGDPRRKDGVPAMAVPYRGSAPSHISDAPSIRDFDTRRMGWLDAEDRSGARECILVLVTAADDPLSWLRAGEALQRVWLEATRANYAMSLFSQVIDIADLRAQLRSELGLAGYPQMVLRAGRGSATPASSRRDLDEILTVVAE
jgi:nitroreductase